VTPVFIIRPPDIVCRLTCILPVFLSFFLFFRQLISELAERNWTIFVHMVGSKCNLKMHVRNLEYPFPLQIGGPKTTFLARLRNLTVTLTAYIFGMEHDIDNRLSALTTTRVLLHHLKMSWTLVHKRLKIRPEFSPTLREFCIVLPTRCTRKPKPTKCCQSGGNTWRWCEPNKVAPHTECKCNHRS